MKVMTALIIGALSFGSGLTLAQEDSDSADNDSYVEPSVPEESGDDTIPSDEGEAASGESADTIEDTDF